MNILSKLLLTLTLIAGSAEAVFDLNNPPAEIPTELQDRLAWGLFNLDADVVAEALGAGASSKVEFSQTSENGETYTRFRNAYGFLLGFNNLARSLFQIQCPHSPSEAEEYEQQIEGTEKLQLINQMTKSIEQLHKLHTVLAVLITKGVSVDRKFNDFLGVSSMREFVNRRIENYPYESGRESHLIANLVLIWGNCELPMWQHLQLLIEKHQPEIKA